jgi:hemerythrin-like domain-containing protein
MLTYFREYSGQFHHTVERLIYIALQDCLPEVASDIEFIEQQHGKIAQENAKFSAAVQGMLADAEVSRRVFCDAARTFIAFKRKHIRSEELSLFYLATLKLSPMDWFTIDRETRRLRAPLSEQQGEYFRKIYIDVTASNPRE